MFFKALLLSGCLSVCLSQTVLLRDGNGRSVSHHEKTVSDATSTVHRHHTQAHNNPLGRSSTLLTTNPLLSRQSLFSSPSPLLTRQTASPLLNSASPSLLQHADGRFYALNANLVPGQVFQTADGRFFTLADDQTAVPMAADSTADDEVVIAREAAPTTTTLAPRTTPAPTAAPRTTAAPATAAPRATGVIAAAPLTSSTARFVAAQPNLADLRSFAAAHPAQFAQFTGLRSFNAAPQLHHINHVAAPAFTRVAAAPVAVSHAGHVGHVGHVGQGHHLLADSRTNVFTGFYSFPNAGINFEY